MKYKFYWGMLLLALFTSQACSSSSSTTSTSTTTDSDSTESSVTSFPAGLTLASPLDSTTTQSSLIKALTNNVGPQTSFSVNQDTIDAILAGTDISDCSHNIATILQSFDLNADCYGPQVQYENFPEGAGGNGNLPTGDLGLWTAVEGDTTEACAAAQLNERMGGLGTKVQTALEAMASLVCVANVNSISLPEAGSEIDLVAEMNSMSTENSLGNTYTTATLAASTVDSNTAYTYDIVVGFEEDGTDYELNLAMTHVLLTEDNSTFKGRFSYWYNAPGDNGRMSACTAVDSDSDTFTDTTVAGSVLYDLSDATELLLRADAAYYCGYDAPAINSTTGLLDPADVEANGTNEDGWGASFTSVIANFNPETIDGNYAFSWQAGTGDSNSRVFNIAVDMSGSTPAAEAFYGYGAAAEDWDGNIGGFICNWAGPGGNHTYVNFVQHQTLTQAEGATVFTATDSDLQYAPVVACEYAGGAFTYDIDGSGGAPDATDDTDVGNGVENELLPVTDANADDVFDEIVSAGFTTPTAPSNF